MKKITLGLLVCVSLLNAADEKQLEMVKTHLGILDSIIALQTESVSVGNMNNKAWPKDQLKEIHSLTNQAFQAKLAYAPIALAAVTGNAPSNKRTSANQVEQRSEPTVEEVSAFIQSRNVYANLPWTIVNSVGSSNLSKDESKAAKKQSIKATKELIELGQKLELQNPSQKAVPSLMQAVAEAIASSSQDETSAAHVNSLLALMLMPLAESSFRYPVTGEAKGIASQAVDQLKQLAPSILSQDGSSNKEDAELEELTPLSNKVVS